MIYFLPTFPLYCYNEGRLLLQSRFVLTHQAMPFGPRIHANWVKYDECSHSRDSLRVVEIRWIRVPIANKPLTVASQVVVGVFTLGLYPLKGLFHECIEVTFVCDECHSGAETHSVVDKEAPSIEDEQAPSAGEIEQCPPASNSSCQRQFTAEILRDSSKRGEGDIRFECGQYKRLEGVRKMFIPESRMTVEDVEKEYDEVGKRYYLLRENCYHWSRTLWSKLTAGPHE